jgi:hypothetical protein
LLVNKYGDLELRFSLSDSSLIEYYSIKKDSKSILFDVNKKKYQGEEVITFDGGNFLFIVEDNFSNKYEKTISLENDLSIDFRDTYTNDNKIRVRADADRCVLTSIDSDNLNRDFNEKASNNFEYEYDFDNEKKYEIEIYCEKGEYRVYEKTNIYFDETAPLLGILDYNIENDGSISFQWANFNDKLTKDSDLKYRLFRDKNQIYQGNSLEFNDYDIEYPQTYQYYLEVVDLANNKVETDTIDLSPKKSKIYFNSPINIRDDINNSVFKLEFETEKDLDINVKIKNNGEVYNEFDFRSENNIISRNIELKEGLNEILLTLKDNYSNEKQITYMRNYLPRDLNVGENSSIKEDVKNENVSLDKPNLIYITLLIITILILSLIIYINKSIIWGIFNRKKRKSRAQMLRKRKEDLVLGKSILNIKKRRIEKEKRKSEKEKKQKIIKREKSEYESSKLKDLSKEKKNIDLSKISRRKKTKRHINLVRNDNLDRNPFDEKKTNSFSFGSYLENLSSKKSWNSTNEYRKSYIDKKNREKEDKLKEIERRKEEEERLKRLDVEKKIREVKKKEEDRLRRHNFKTSLDDYLQIKTTKKRRFNIMEKRVEQDIRKRLEDEN